MAGYYAVLAVLLLNHFFPFHDVTCNLIGWYSLCKPKNTLNCFTNSWGKFNNLSALGRSFYWCQALHIMNKDRYQSTSARRALALLNSPLYLQHVLIDFSLTVKGATLIFISGRGSGTGPFSAVGNVSGNRCESDCRSGGREFDPGPVPYFCGDWSWNNYYGHSPSFGWIIQEGLLSVTSESMCMKYWLTACSSLPRKKCG